MYFYGQGVSKDYQKARDLYLLAAEQGNFESQKMLGDIFYQGIGVAQNYEESVKWYRLSAEQGYDLAQVMLSILYGQGRGVKRNFVIAHMLANLAAAQGNENGRRLRDTSERELTFEQIAEAQMLSSEWQPGMTIPTETSTWP
ncbi:tetratricopeptide repeat protein [Halomonas sp. PGE1]|uniref:tetratricopeptide repeat protein n=1 Tax=Halomonas sp. PGE1 TaxID=2730360 RepID=UPI0024B50CCE|nr:tetratricopeptide repeat protein [Halomonas sp. PGE1]